MGYDVKSRKKRTKDRWNMERNLFIKGMKRKMVAIELRKRINGH